MVTPESYSAATSSSRRGGSGSRGRSDVQPSGKKRRRSPSPEDDEAEAFDPTPKVAMAEETKDQRLARQRAEQSKIIKDLRLWCIFDPRGAVKGTSETKLEASWVNTILRDEAEVKELMGIKALKGFVLRDKSQKNGVIIYDWVRYLLFVCSRTYTRSPGIHRIPLLPAGRVHCRLQDMEGVLGVASDARSRWDGREAQERVRRLYHRGNRPFCPVRQL
jgi:hypothetical protein